MRLALAALIAGLAVQPAFAQHKHGGPAAAAYPEVCRTDAAAPAAAPHAGHDADAMEDHQKAAMDGMAKMDADMMQGMMQKDADTAFICGMIAHHQGAIDMARVELEYGDDQWSKDLAQRIIDAQMKEIEEMTGWLAKNAK